VRLKLPVNRSAGSLARVEWDDGKNKRARLPALHPRDMLATDRHFQSHPDSLRPLPFAVGCAKLEPDE